MIFKIRSTISGAGFPFATCSPPTTQAKNLPMSKCVSAASTADVILLEAIASTTPDADSCLSVSRVPG